MPTTKRTGSTRGDRAPSAKAPASGRRAAAPAMKFEKTRPEMAAFFDHVMPGPERGVEKRSMFGAPVRFINGNMAMGLHNNRIILRLSDVDRSRFMKVDGAAIFEPMAGRLMREYVVVPEALRHEEAKLATWIDRSLAYVSSLPPKAPKKKR